MLCKPSDEREVGRRLRAAKVVVKVEDGQFERKFLFKRREDAEHHHGVCAAGYGRQNAIAPCQHPVGPDGLPDTGQHIVLFHVKIH